MKLTAAGLLAAFCLVAGCSINPPTPPKCDGSERRPINSVRQTAAVDAPVDKCSRG